MNNHTDTRQRSAIRPELPAVIKVNHDKFRALTKLTNIKRK